MQRATLSCMSQCVCVHVWGGGLCLRNQRLPFTWKSFSSAAHCHTFFTRNGIRPLIFAKQSHPPTIFGHTAGSAHYFGRAGKPPAAHILGRNLAASRPLNRWPNFSFSTVEPPRRWSGSNYGYFASAMSESNSPVIDSRSLTIRCYIRTAQWSLYGKRAVRQAVQLSAVFFFSFGNVLSKLFSRRSTNLQNEFFRCGLENSGNWVEVGDGTQPKCPICHEANAVAKRCTV